MTCYALHGFLGKPDDWNFLENVCPIDLWKGEIAPFWDWTREFNRKRSGELIGYSLGGRLALHALIDSPEQWKSAILISAHPGLKNGDVTRLAEDLAWAKRFESEAWDSLMQDWNRRPVFGSDRKLARDESDFDREKLARSLRVWSLGRQESLKEKIAALPMPILWVVGEKDKKFSSIARELKFSHPQSKAVIVPNSGHRVIFEHSAILNRITEEWKHDIDANAILDTC